MGHYAFLNQTNVVTEVIVGVNENELLDGLIPEEYYSKIRGQKCVRTSYNKNIRGNFAGIGFTYDEELDVFIPPKPFDSWILNQESFQWEAPTPMPSIDHYWSEEDLTWKSERETS